MLNRFRNLSIRRKLIAILLLTNCIVLALVSAAFVVNEASTFRTEVREELAALAEILGNNTSAAVAFNDRASASETLSGLRAKPEIRAAFVVLARIGLSGGEELPLSLEDKRLVLAVGRHDDAELPGEPESPVKLRVVDPEGALVGEEYLEGADAAPDDLTELGVRPVVELGGTHVEGEIASGAAGGLGHPVLKPGKGVLVAGRAAHLDERCRASD